jgi:ribonuclease HII
VVAAVILPAARRVRLDGLADSKLLTPAVREQMYAEVVRAALAWRAIVIPPGDIDRGGLHRMNIEGMRRAVAGLDPRPGYVLTDGFPVPGLGIPSLGVIKGDQVAASICAASIVAKVTRDRIMVALHDRYPEYDFWRHKGYVTAAHSAALDRHGPSSEHRLSYVNVAEALRGRKPRLEDTMTMASLHAGVRE